MNSLTAARTSRSTRTLLVAPKRFASSLVGPSRPSQPKVKRPRSQRQRGVATPVLRNLVNLHHSSSSFLHSPEEIDVGFENAFRHTSGEPQFQPYYRYRADALATGADRGQLVERGDSPDSVGAELRKRERLRPAPSYWRTFKKYPDLWSDRAKQVGEDGGMLSVRELAVKEALFGTWERGGIGMKTTQPGLDGVLEYIEAKGVSVEEYAKEWADRDQVDDGEQSS